MKSPKKCGPDRKPWKGVGGMYNPYAQYSLTNQAQRDMVAAQRGRCGICGRKPKSLVVDHDHKTGKVRALLCRQCNCGLGFFQDDPLTLEAARDYIVQHAET